MFYRFPSSYPPTQLLTLRANCFLLVVIKLECRCLPCPVRNINNIRREFSANPTLRGFGLLCCWNESVFFSNDKLRDYCKHGLGVCKYSVIILVVISPLSSAVSSPVSSPVSSTSMASASSWQQAVGDSVASATARSRNSSSSLSEVSARARYLHLDIDMPLLFTLSLIACRSPSHASL